jgi:hypothetical protein
VLTLDVSKVSLRSEVVVPFPFASSGALPVWLELHAAAVAVIDAVTIHNEVRIRMVSSPGATLLPNCNHLLRLGFETVLHAGAAIGSRVTRKCSFESDRNQR